MYCSVPWWACLVTGQEGVFIDAYFMLIYYYLMVPLSYAISIKLIHGAVSLSLCFASRQHCGFVGNLCTREAPEIVMCGGV